MTGMRINKPRGVISGFHADRPEPAVPELHFLGEQWAPEDYAIGRHSHPVWEFYLQLDGWSLWRDATGKEFACPPGAFYAPPPGLAHWLHRTGGGKHHFVFAAIDAGSLCRRRLPELLPLWTRPTTVHLADGRQCEAAFRALVRETLGPVQPFRASAFLAALETLVVEASRLIAGPEPPADPLKRADGPVAQAMQAMASHPGEPWRLADLGRLTGLSPNHLASLFVVQAGQSPRQYLLGRRLDQARERLLNGKESVTQIALALGFHSSQHFARVFREAEGCSATSFRQSRRGGSSRYPG